MRGDDVHARARGAGRRAAPPASRTPRRPSPTARLAPTSERTIEWQNASACTVATTSPASGPSTGRDHANASSVRIVVAPGARLAVRREVVAARPAAARPPPSRRRPARGGATARACGTAGRAGRRRRRSGTCSAGAGPRTARRSRRPRASSACTTRSAGRMPPSRVSSTSSTGRDDRPLLFSIRPAGDVDVRHLAARVHAGVRPPGHRHARRPVGAQDGAQRGLQHPLDGPQARLDRPAGEPGAVVGQVQPQPHGGPASARPSARRVALGRPVAAARVAHAAAPRSPSAPSVGPCPRRHRPVHARRRLRRRRHQGVGPRRRRHAARPRGPGADAVPAAPGAPRRHDRGHRRRPARRRPRRPSGCRG